ncbi:MAG TPA: patatin-like phospholipase family protein [Planktothrix sp.]|jgi:predicted acylesterase/phospholipase RssA
MEKETKQSLADWPNRRLHAVFGSGGTKAVLAGTGAVLAFSVAKLPWDSIGGASGGSIPAGVLAHGAAPREFLRHVVDSDFQRLLLPQTGFVGRLLALLRKYHYESTRPRKGAYGTRLLRRFVNGIVPCWPNNFWTVATCDHGQVLFTKRGVFKYAAGETVGRLMAPEPPSVGRAVCASCAIPGILDGVPYADEILFDGALSGDGEVPVGVVARHFQAYTATIVAVDVGEEPLKQARWLRFLWNVFCGGKCDTSFDGVHPEERDGLIIIKPELKGFHALEFELKRETKWAAVVSGFLATAKSIDKHALVAPSDALKLRNLVVLLNEVEMSGLKGKQYVAAVESVLQKQGLL